MFRLTRQEQALVIFILLSLVVGSAVKYYRRAHLQPASNPAAAPAEHAKQDSRKARTATEEER